MTDIVDPIISPKVLPTNNPDNLYERLPWENFDKWRDYPYKFDVERIPLTVQCLGNREAGLGRCLSGRCHVIAWTTKSSLRNNVMVGSKIPGMASYPQWSDPDLLERENTLYLIFPNNCHKLVIDWRAQNGGSKEDIGKTKEESEQEVSANETA
jgi:hypothetical protein